MFHCIRRICTSFIPLSILNLKLGFQKDFKLCIQKLLHFYFVHNPMLFQCFLQLLVAFFIVNDALFLSHLLCVDLVFLHWTWVIAMAILCPAYQGRFSHCSPRFCFIPFTLSRKLKSLFPHSAFILTLLLSTTGGQFTMFPPDLHNYNYLKAFFYPSGQW